MLLAKLEREEDERMRRERKETIRRYGTEKRLKKKVAETRGGRAAAVLQACRHVGRFTWRGQPALLETYSGDECRLYDSLQALSHLLVAEKPPTRK